MNGISVLLYAVLDKLIYLNLQFNYIPSFHRANFLSLSVKKGDTNIFCKTVKVSPMECLDVIKMKGMIAHLTFITVI